MPLPKDNVGKICISLEKYFDVTTGRIQVKRRPVLIIGYEDDYSSPLEVDYEILPISTMKNRAPNPTYDLKIDENLRVRIGLDEPSYIRTHKTTWNHSKHMQIERPVGDIIAEDPFLFNQIIYLNQQWVNNRSNQNIVREVINETAVTEEDE